MIIEKKKKCDAHGRKQKNGKNKMLSPTAKAHTINKSQ